MTCKIAVIAFFLASVLFSIGSPTNSSVHKSHPESRLQHDLFEHYNPNVRPSINNQRIDVRVDVALNHIMELKSASQTLTAALYFNIRWIDGFLSWKSDEYGGVGSIVVPASKVWLPDLGFINAVKDAYGFGLETSAVKINSDGMISFWGQKTKEFTCLILTKKFPFDKHHCNITLGFVVSDSWEIFLSPANHSIDLRWYTETPEWTIVENSVIMDLAPDHYNETTGKYSIIHYMFSIQRNCKTCVMNIIFPVLLLSFLNLLTFHVPVTSGEKLAFPVSIFLTVAVFLTVINGSLPEAVDGVSYLAIWVTVELGFCALTLVCTVMTLHMYNYKCNSWVFIILKAILLRPKSSTQLERKEKYHVNSDLSKNNINGTSRDSKMDERKEARSNQDDTDNRAGTNQDLELVCKTLDNILFLLFLLCQGFTLGVFAILFVI